MKSTRFLIMTGLVLLMTQTVQASEEGHPNGPEHMLHDQNISHMDADMDKNNMKGMFLVKKEIDGYDVSFHVMKAKEGMEHGGPYNLMVKVEKDGKALTDLLINSKAVHPNGESESKMLMKMGDWYMAGYNLGHPGRHQLMILFKTPDGAKHFGGVYYPE